MGGLPLDQAATLVATAAGALVFLGLVCLGVMRSALTGGLAPLWVTVRRGALLILQPLILLVTVPVSVQFGSFALSIVGAMIPLAIVSIALNAVISPLFGNSRELTVNVGHFALIAAIAAAVGALHVLFRLGWIGGPLKIVLDIVRYMGSPEYRTELQKRFDDELQERLGPGRADGGGSRCSLTAWGA